jgi:hypothetical protein
MQNPLLVEKKVINLPRIGNPNCRGTTNLYLVVDVMLQVENFKAGEGQLDEVISSMHI